MKILVDDAYVQELRGRIMDFYTQEAKRENKMRDRDKLYHVSDIVFPRKAYYEAILGRKINDEALGMWISGKAFGYVLQESLGKSKAEVEARWGKFIAHIDHFDKVLLEIKTSRKWTVPQTPEPHYVRQVGYYCAMTNTLHGKVVVIYFTAGRKWGGGKSAQASTLEFKAWDVGFTEKELEHVRYDMTKTVEMIELAIRTKNPSVLPPAPKWLLKDYPDAILGKYGKKEQDAERISPFNFVDVRAE